MNVLVINGSPRGGGSNTMALTRAFLEGAGWDGAEIINAAEAGVKDCAGCFGCWTRTPGKCVIRDGMDGILPKMIAADVLIWSFPLYYYGVPGVLKNIIDRQLPTSLPFMANDKESGGHPKRYDLTRRRHVVISTCGFWTARGNYDAVTAMFDRMYGAEKYANVFCGQGEVFRVPEVKPYADAYLESVRRAGAEFAEGGGIAAETLDGLAGPIFEREVFEKMADASWNMDPSGQTPLPAGADDSLAFTRQMAALYRPDGVERVVEFRYTDIGKTCQILLTKQGSEVITEAFRPHTTRIETPYAVWRSISRGEISGQDALFQRLFTVTGDFHLMLKWGELFGPPASEKFSKKPAGPAAERKTSMLLLLAPWILLWNGLAVSPAIGGAAGVAAAAFLPLLWLRFRPVVFERISVPVVAGISLAALLGAGAGVLASAGQILFGLLWAVGTFTKIPLTAHYSAKNYGGGRAFANPLFLRTNRILTAAWGALNLATGCWTYAAAGGSLSPFIKGISPIATLLMGIFTVWFQKWHPARWARG